MQDEAIKDLLPRVQMHILDSGVNIPGWEATTEEQRQFRAAVAQAMVKLRLDRDLPGGNDRLADVATRLAGMMTGIGVLEDLLPQDGVEEIIVREGFVQVERRGQIEDAGPLAHDGHFEQIARRAADLGRRTLKGNRPYVLVDLPDKSRFTAIVPPLSARGTAINVRVFAREVLSFGDLDTLGAFAAPIVRERGASDAFLEHVNGERIDGLPPVAQLLIRIAAGNLATVLISGEFGAGKTTLMNAMSLYVPDWVQLAVVETFEELKIHHPHPLRVVVPGDRPDFPSMDEILNVVITRMRPDLLIIGEIVRDEAPRFLDAINLGKKAWSTIHGNDARGALYRLETKALTTGLPHQAIREQIAAGVDLVVHLQQDAWSGDRYVAQVVIVRGLDGDGRYDLQPLYDVRRGEGTATVETLWKRAKDD
jgi:pilus assembly protein CpaF